MTCFFNQRTTYSDTAAHLFNWESFVSIKALEGLQLPVTSQMDVAWCRKHACLITLPVSKCHLFLCDLCSSILLLSMYCMSVLTHHLCVFQCRLFPDLSPSDQSAMTSFSRRNKGSFLILTHQCLFCCLLFVQMLDSL